MKKTVILIFGSIVGLAILVQSGVLDALLAFLLVGAIPGTSYSIPSGFMLLLMATVMWLVVLKLTLFEATSSKKPRSTKVKKTMPRRRYSQI